MSFVQRIELLAPCPLRFLRLPGQAPSGLGARATDKTVAPSIMMFDSHARMVFCLAAALQTRAVLTLPWGG
jgi:hypothetical protein